LDEGKKASAPPGGEAQTSKKKGTDLQKGCGHDFSTTRPRRVHRQHALRVRRVDAANKGYSRDFLSEEGGSSFEGGLLIGPKGKFAGPIGGEDASFLLGNDLPVSERRGRPHERSPEGKF